MNSRARFPELDLLRFIAACGVMLFHYTYLAPQHHLLPGSFPILSQIGKYGFLGVDVFFILSGFVILLTAYEKDAIAFAVARMLRLYPAYWICVTLTAAAIVVTRSLPATVTPFQYFANLTMVHGFFGIRDVSGVYWTLAVEIQFYFLIFLILLIGQIRRLGYLLGLWLLASVILSLQEPRGIIRFFLFPEWSSYFIAGAMLFLIHREGPSLYKLFVVGACYVLSTAYAINLLPFGAGHLEADFSAPVIVSALAISYATFLFIAIRPRSGKKMASALLPLPNGEDRSEGAGERVAGHGVLPLPKGEGRGEGEGTVLQPNVHQPARRTLQPTSRVLTDLIKLLGLITYPLYLLHQDIGYILFRSAPAGVNRLLLLVAVMFAMIALACLVHIGPDKWLVSRLKSLLSGPLSVANSLKLVISQRFAGVDLKPAIPDRLVPTLIPIEVSSVPSAAQPTQPATADSHNTGLSTAPNPISPSTV